MAAIAAMLACTGCASWAGSLVATADPAPAAHQRLSLDGEWTVWLDPDAVGLDQDWAEALCDGREPPGATGAALELVVPGPLEALRETTGYDGVAFYARDLIAPPHALGARSTLHFERVNHTCRVWLDGAYIGSHEGGYDAFALDVSGRLEAGERHRLVVMVIDPGATPVLGLTLKTTPHAKESWYENQGGLLGSVALTLDEDWTLDTLQLVPDPGAGAVDVDLTLLAPASLGEHALRLDLSLTTDGSTEELASRSIQLPHATGRELSRQLRMVVPEPRPWSPEDPQLYALTVDVNGNRLATRRFGFRTIEIAGGDLLLNGERRVLKGVLYQPHHTGSGGVEPPAAELEQEVLDILGTGFDLVRMHVRPAPEAFLDAADRHGLLVLEEPAIGWVEDHPELLRRMTAELDWMAVRDNHHPSIILWGVLNELSGRAYRYAEPLARHLSTLDPSRPVLVDSGGFLVGGRMLPPGDATGPLKAMVDKHAYPPYPLPVEDRRELAALRGRGDAPVFVSEFGYGTLLDAERALEGFVARGILFGDEVVKFRSYASLQRRLVARDEPGGDPAQRAAADENQADAAEDLIEVLRTNPSVDMLCYTQWQAASSESSAGLLGPWGEDRPARERVRRALRPLLVSVQPERPSVRVDEESSCRIAVVNDTRATVTGELRLTHALRAADGSVVQEASRLVGAASFAPGVSTRSVELPAQTTGGTLELAAVLRCTDGSDGPDEVSTTREVAVVAPDPSPAKLGPVWAPGADARARAFLRGAGFRVVRGTDEPFAAALIAEPERLSDELTMQERIVLWNLVWQGGTAVVLMGSPGEGEREQLLGGARGIRTLTGLPVAPAIGAAPGNFMGRLHLERTPDDQWVALGRGDEVLSPRAMFVGPLPPGAEQQLITLGHLGNRMGAPEVTLPFGRGCFHLIGLPLLDVVDAQVDPRRDARLARAVRDALQSSVANLPAGGPTPAPTLSPPDAQALDTGLKLIARVVALGDRASPLTSAGQGTEPRLPAGPAAALALRRRAIEALLDGRPDETYTLLRQAVELVWNDDVERFLAQENVVLELVAERADDESHAGWDVAYDALEMWGRAVVAWFGDEPDAALDWLGRAELRLREGTGVDTGA